MVGSWECRFSGRYSVGERGEGQAYDGNGFPPRLPETHLFARRSDCSFVERSKFAYGNDGHVTVGAKGRFSECLEVSIAIDRQVDVCSGVFATGENRMTLSPDYYAVLGVPSTASRDTIHSAWKALLRQYHPDANHGVDVSARAKEINEAYAVLGKADARAAYDRSRPGPSPHQAAPDRPVQPRKASRRSMRPNPSMQPSGSYSQPLETSGWLMGLFLLILTTAPLGTILVLCYEEAGSASTIHHSPAVRRVPLPPAKAVGTAPGMKLGIGSPAP